MVQARTADAKKAYDELVTTLPGDARALVARGQFRQTRARRSRRRRRRLRQGHRARSEVSGGLQLPRAGRWPIAARPTRRRRRSRSTSSWRRTRPTPTTRWRTWRCVAAPPTRRSRRRKKALTVDASFVVAHAVLGDALLFAGKGKEARALVRGAHRHRRSADPSRRRDARGALVAVRRALRRRRARALGRGRSGGEDQAAGRPGRRARRAGARAARSRRARRRRGSRCVRRARRSTRPDNGAGAHRGRAAPAVVGGDARARDGAGGDRRAAAGRAARRRDGRGAQARRRRARRARRRPRSRAGSRRATATTRRRSASWRRRRGRRCGWRCALAATRAGDEGKARAVWTSCRGAWSTISRAR